MTWISGIGTYLPTNGTPQARIAGPDEDTVTLGVAAGLQALAAAGHAKVAQVVMITRDPALLDGGSAAVLLAGLGLDPGTACHEVLGGAPAALDTLLSAAPATLVVGADLEPAGAAAALVSGPAPKAVTRINRSLPTTARDAHGHTHAYDDVRLDRERGLKLSLQRLDLPAKPVLVAGVAGRAAADLCEGPPPRLPTLGASAALFAVAAMAEGLSGTLLAAEQATLVAATLAVTAPVSRSEPPARAARERTASPGPDIRITLPAYERAFEPKLRWEAGQCGSCGTLAFPPRYRCLDCGAEVPSRPTPLPRTGSVYTHVTIHVPVPGMATPYSLAIIDLDGVDVRSLVQVTGDEPVGIGHRGSLVFRRVAVRSGVPDYGYAFTPDGASA